MLIVDSVLEPIGNAAKDILNKEGYQVDIVVNGQSKQGHPNMQEIINSSDIEMVEPTLVCNFQNIFMACRKINLNLYSYINQYLF